MKVLKRKMLNVLLAFVMVFSFAFSGWGVFLKAINVTADSAALETEFTNNGQFSLSEYSGVAYSFVDGAAEGLPAGSEGAVLKIADNGAAYINVDFSAAKILASTVESVVVRAYSPDYTADDELRINNGSGSVGGAGAHNMSTWCDISLPLATITGADGNLGAFALGLRDKGTISPYFYIDSITVNMKATTKVSLTGIHAYWNHCTDIGDYYSILEFSGGIAVGSIDANYSNLLAKMTLNDQPIDTANLSFIVRAWLDGTGDSIIMKWVTSPAEGAILKFPAGATFTNGSADTNLYEIAEDTYLQFNGAKWAVYIPPVEPTIVPVTFTHINSSWNDNTETLGNGMRYTILHLNGVQTSGYYTQGDDWTEMMANSTINGGASYFNFCPASFIAGPNAASDFIVIYTATAPTAGDEFVVTAGTTFKVGGDDTNVYQLTDDIRLVYNGAAWATPASATYYVVETTENGGVIHTLSTFQNVDGSFTYTLPEYTAEGKVLLGYALTEGGVEKMLPAGEYTTMDGSGLIFSALWAGFNTQDGASIRIASAETSGIRWTTTIDEAGFANVAYWAKGGYSFGTELSADGFAENFDIIANTWKVENSTYTGVLIDINSKYYETVFTARGYVDITYSNGETKRIYAQANDTTRSIKEVAEKAIASGDYSGTQLSILQQIAGV